jgi:glycine/D-amino acid oxidase-like deaminating enzyme
MFDVIVVGLGVAGASAAYHLINHSKLKILCLEQGIPGKGTEKEKSGTAVFENGPKTIKMILTLPTINLEEFFKHHTIQEFK